MAENYDLNKLKEDTKVYILDSGFSENEIFANEFEFVLDRYTDSLLSYRENELNQESMDPEAKLSDSELIRKYDKYIRKDYEALALLLTVYELMIFPGELMMAINDTMGNIEIEKINLDEAVISYGQDSRSISSGQFNELGSLLFPDEFNIQDFY